VNFIKLTRKRLVFLAVFLAAAIGLIATANPGHATIAEADYVQVGCSDNTGDASTIQTAINDSSNGETIDIEGTCELTSGLVLYGDRTYTGGGTLNQDGTMSYMLASRAYTTNATSTGNPMTIENLTLNGSGAGSTDGIIIENWDTVVQDMTVNDMGGAGIVDTNTNSDGGTLTNSSVNSRFENNYVQSSGSYGFEVLDSGNSVTDGYFTDNQVGGSGIDGVYLQNAAGWNVSDNHLYSDNDNAIVADRMWGSKIAGNYIEDFGSTQTSGTWYGIEGTQQGGIGSVVTGNNVFNDNGEKSGSDYEYIAVSNNSGTGTLSVTGNSIVTDQSSDEALVYSDGSGTLDYASTGNAVTGPGTPVTSTATAINGGTGY
jgi:hypothetical protein